MLNTCVILNGPPNSGKDTLADLLTAYGFKKQEMKARLYEDTANHFDVDLPELKRRATDRILKEEGWYELPYDWELLQSMSPREALIHTSETVIKPNHGDDYFGLAAAGKCKLDYATLAVFSDGGFEAEIAPLIDAYKNVLIFRLHRDGCTFEGDSRDYLEGFDNTYDVDLIDGQPDQAITEIIEVLDPLIYDLRVA